MMASTVKQKYLVKGAALGARGCSSCTCDPCDCDPCTCGDDELDGTTLPQWRVSAYHIHSGHMGTTDLSHLLVLSLALPVHEQEQQRWQEVILVPETAMSEQVSALLDLFEDDLRSLPAEAGSQPATKQAVYAVPLEYVTGTDKPTIRVRFQPEHPTLVREGALGGHAHLPEWNYDGPLAVREHFDRHS